MKTEEEINMEKLVKNMKSSVGKKFIESCNVIVKVCENIIKEPKNEKYRWMKKSNKKIKALISGKKGAMKMMLHLGFIETKNSDGEDCIHFPESRGVTNLKGKLLIFKQEVQKKVTKTY